MEKAGEQFLHQKEPRLHISGPVEHEKSRKERAGEKMSQKPAEKISDWLKVIEKTHLGHRDDPRVLERIKNYYHKEYVIDPEDIPESYFDNQKRLAREQGHGDIEVTDEMREQLTEVIVSDQESTLDNWIEYFTSPDSDSYPMWAKYWAFNNMVKLSSFDKEKHAFAKRDKGTVAPFPDLNREALAYAVDAIVKKAHKEHIPATEDNPELKQIIDSASFGKLYAYAIEKVTPTEKKELLNTAGEWKKYPRRSDCMPLVESLQGHGTGWCTAGESTAETQLEGGDFHVYYSYDKNGQPTVPRVAIRMFDNNIAEVRGVGSDQNLDPYIGEVVSKKLAEFPDGKAYEKKSADMKRLTEIEKRQTKGEELTKDDLHFLYELDSKIEGFGYEKDPRIKEIISGRDVKADLSLATGFAKEQIGTTEKDALQGGIKFHYGELDLSGLSWSEEGFTFPETVWGNIFLFGFESANGLILPKSVRGRLFLNDLCSTYGLKLPESVGGGIDLGCLQSAEGLVLPENIGGILDLSGLKSAEGLNLPKSVVRDLDLSGLKSAEGLNLPKSVGRNLALSGLESAEGLNLPESVGGSLDLNSIKSAEGLKFPESIGGDLYLRNLASAEGLKFPESIGGGLFLDKLTSAEGLKLPEKIGGCVNLDSITSAEGLEPPEIIGGNLVLRSLTSAKGLKLPEKMVGGDLYLRDLASFEDLELPEIFSGDLQLGWFKSVEGLKFPRIINGSLILAKLESADGLKLPEQVSGDLDLTSITSAEGLVFPLAVGDDISLSRLRSIKGLVLPETVGGRVVVADIPERDLLKLRGAYPKLQIYHEYI